MQQTMLTRPGLARMTEDLLRAEITAARGSAATLPAGPWYDQLAIGADGLGADSLERLSLAAAVNEQFHLHETGIEDALLAGAQFGDWLDVIARSWAINAQRISFRTSGSTGRARRCTHRFADLVSEAGEHAARLQPRRILSAVPAHHIYGCLFTVLLPAIAACDVIDIRNRLPALSEFRAGDVIVSFPEHWRFLARSLDRLPPVTGISSTAPLPGDLAEEISSAGLARLVEIYGSSETAGIGWRDDPADPFELLDVWSVAERPDPDGALRLIAADGRIVQTPDVVALRDARHFQVLRRIDGAVQVGGINVYPTHIAERLESHPLVAQARVRLAAAGQGGRLKALVVPKTPPPDPDRLRRELEQWISAHLPGPQRPRSLTIVAQLPHGLLGKECDWEEVG